MLSHKTYFVKPLFFADFFSLQEEIRDNSPEAPVQLSIHLCFYVKTYAYLELTDRRLTVIVHRTHVRYPHSVV